MSTEIRVVESYEEKASAHQLGNFAFGRKTDFTGGDPTDPAKFWAIFEGSEMLAKLGVRPYDQYFGGRAVPMGGLCGVAVAPEGRGGGRAKSLIAHSLPQMRDAGQVISSLYPTAVGLYRSMGWEFGGMWPRVKIRTTNLGRARGGEDVTTRRCTEADLPELERQYTEFASARNGMLTRIGAAFPKGAADVVTEFDGAPLAIRDGKVVGYATYSRGTGWAETAEIVVQDLIGADAGATAALLRYFAGWASVSSFCSLRFTPDDPSNLVLPDMTPPPSEQMRWMLRMVDAPAALVARGYSPAVSARVELELHDDHAEWNRGRWVLSVEGAKASVQPGGSGSVRLDVRALSALYSCAFDARALRRTGLLTADDAGCDSLDLIFVGQPSVMWDFF